MENSNPLRLLTISSRIAGMKICSGMKATGSPFARAAMTEKQVLDYEMPFLSLRYHKLEKFRSLSHGIISG